MHDIGLDDYVIRIDEVSSQLLVEKFCDLISNEENVKLAISNYIMKAEEKRIELIDYMKKK